MTTHLIIPDTQIKPNTPTNHILAAANFAVKKKPDVIVILGDWWDMPSLSSYEKKGSKFFEGKRILEDIKVGNEAMTLFMSALNLEEYNAKRKKNKHKQWNPRIVLLMGNHEHRIQRFLAENPQQEGLISYDLLNTTGLEVYNYQVPIRIDGIAYCHNFVNPDSLIKSVVTGTIENKLSKLKMTFTAGHQQRLQFGISYDGLGNPVKGLVAGRFYQHDEAYMGPQGQADWSGIIMKYEVNNGDYDPSFISTNYLLDKYL
jgi:hypothetical protein